MIGPPLNTLLTDERQRVEDALRVVIAEVGSAGQSPVADAVRYALDAGGKRLRPILCVASYRAFRPAAPPALYRLAVALELIHTYSLVHDDLPSMDDDDVRRGRPATHIVHGVATATVAGAALIPAAVRLTVSGARDLGLHDGVRTDLVRTLCRAAGGGGMVGGQVLDLEAEGQGVDVHELARIHRLKTGALLAAAPLMGAIAAGVGPLERDALGVYGASLGLAFQVTDDILDVTGSSAVLGKTAGRDRALEKATYPALMGVAAARRRAEEEVEGGLAALDAAGIESDELTALARYAVERDR